MPHAMMTPATIKLGLWAFQTALRTDLDFLGIDVFILRFLVYFMTKKEYIEKRNKLMPETFALLSLPSSFSSSASPAGDEYAELLHLR